MENHFGESRTDASEPVATLRTRMESMNLSSLFCRFSRLGVRRAGTSGRRCVVGVSCWVAVVGVVGGMVGGVPSVLGQSSDEKAKAIFSDAASFQNNNAFALAAEEWRKLIRQFPEDPLANQARHYLGVSLIQMDPPKIDEAVEVFRQAVEDEKLSVRSEALINLGWCLYTRARNAAPGAPQQAEDLRDAQRAFEEFIAKYPQSPYMDQALFYLGDAHYMQGRPEKAIPFYKRMLDSTAGGKSPLRPDALYAMAVALEELGRDDEARSAYEAFLKEYDGHGLAHEVRVRLADLMMQAQDPKTAERLLVAVAETDPPSDLADYAWLRLGYARSLQKRDEEALAAYERVLTDFAESPHRETAALLAGQILFNQKRFAEAIDRLQLAAQERDTLAVDAAHWIAQAYLQLKQPADALRIAEEALRWAPREASMLLRMDRAEALYAMPQRLADAYAAYAQAADAFPDHEATPRAVYNAALAALRLKKLEEAQRWAELFLSKYPNDPLRTDVAYVAAETMLLQGRYDAAVTAYQELLKANSEDPAAVMWTLRLATAHYLADQFDRAIAVLEPILNRLANDEQRAEAHYILGACYLYQEQIPLAILHLQRSLEASQDWSSADDVTLLLAEALQQAGERGEARQTLQGFLQRYPDSPQRPQAEYRLAQMRADEGEYDAAIAGYESIVANDAAAHLHRFAKYGIAWCTMQQQRYDAALPILRDLSRAPAQDSIAAEAQLAQGVCLRKMGRTEEAISVLRELVQRQPPPVSLAAGWHELGLALTEAGQIEQANVALRKVLEVDPKYVAQEDVLYELAWNLHDAGAMEEAVQVFSDLAEAFPGGRRAAEALYMMGQFHFGQQRFERAESLFAEAVGKAERAGDEELAEKARYKLGWSLFQRGEFDRAGKVFQTQVDRAPRGKLAVDGLFMLGQCAEKQGRVEAALAAFQRAEALLEDSGVEADPRTKTLVYLHAAQAHRELKQYAEALADLDRIADVPATDPQRDAIWFERAWVQQLQGQTQPALELFERVADEYRNATGARARFMMGEIYFQQRQFDQAIAQFQRVMYGYGAERAPEQIKGWQARAALEAARCSETLAGELTGQSRAKMLRAAEDFYRYIVDKHAGHEVARQARSRLGELRKLR